MAPRLQRRIVYRTLLISIVSIVVVFTLLGVYVYFQAVKRFEVRRVALPTRVFTDLFPLRPGVTVSPDSLHEKLERLGYREVDSIRQAGDFVKEKGGGFEVFVRPFDHPSGKHETERVTVRLKDNSITSVTRDGQAVEDVALEPELLTSILGDELENRTPVTLDQVPQHLIDAVVVTEDVRFFRHPGVDAIGVIRAIFRNISARGVTEGGSTLTQQLVKNYYLTSERTFRRKFVEAFMAVILDLKYSKREILEAYLNDIYLGRNRSISILGVGQAANFYFSKPVSELSVPEAALIAGLIRSPNNYSPFVSPEKSRARRDVVLNLMRRNDKIDQAAYDQALRTPLPNKPNRERSGLSSIPYYVDRVLDELSRDYGIEDVQGQGLSIYTAIDLDWQAEATSVLQNGIRGLERSSARLRRTESPLQGAMIGIDLQSGEIRSLVGGRDYEKSQFNRATQAKRQVGSLFKPFVFLAAFEPSLSHQNITPATLVNDARFTLERRYSKDWSPRNYEEVYRGIVTVRQALEQSLNSASVRIGLSAGVESVVKAAHAMGVDTSLPAVPSIILGSVEVPPIEMAEAYTSMGRMGSRIPLRTVRFVTNDRGNVVAAGEVEAVQVFPARDVYLVVHIMEGVVNRGTGARSRAQGFRRTAAGKTGTTNDKRDAWFAGFTPDTLALTWLGFDDNKPTGLSGSDGAVPIWARYMAAITAGQADREFPVPSGVVFAEIDTSSGGLSTENCPRNLIVNEAFKAGTEPHGICPLHGYPMMAGTMYPYGIPPGTTTDMYPPGMPPMDPLPPLPPITIPPVSTSTTPSSTQPAPQPTRNDPPLQGGVFRTETAEQPAPSPEIRREGEPPPTATLPPTTSEPTTTNPE